MLGIKGSSDSKKTIKEDAAKRLSRKKMIRITVLSTFLLVAVIYIILGVQKSIYADFAKTKLKELVIVWLPIGETNDQTIETDIENLNLATTRIKLEVERAGAPINSTKLKKSIISFFEYANTFTTEMHNDFEWSKELSVISNEDDKAILGINFNDGMETLETTLGQAITTMNTNIARMDAMKYSRQVAESHHEFRNNVVEESALYSRLLAAVKANDTIALDTLGSEIKVFNEKFGKMSGPSSALTIAYAIKTKEFEIKIEKLGKEIDYASNILINNLY